MILRYTSLCAATTVLLGSTVCNCLSQSDIPSDTPIASLVASAKANLASGNSNDALTYYDVAISRDPDNYLTIFQRGATYLSLGKNTLATSDFDKVLSIKPDFEGALLQRAKIKGKSADWPAARRDYEKAGKQSSVEYQQLQEAEDGAAQAKKSEKAKDWEGCVNHLNAAIMVASSTVDLRRLRAKCRFERGEVFEGVSDLQHVLQLAPGSVDPHIQISSVLFYSVGDTEKGLAAIRSCLHSDPESKPCKKLHRQEKNIDKKLKKIAQLEDKRQYNSAAKLLVGDGSETGLIEDVKMDIKAAKAAGTINPNSPNEFYIGLVEKTCHFYNEMNNKRKAGPYCEETLKLNPDSLPALLFKARSQIDAEEYEPALHTLNHIKEHHPDAQEVGSLIQKAQVLLKRSKTKDYYKVLGVDNQADDRTIKRAYRNLVKTSHPDKAASQGIPKEEAEKKMAAINEAYEVLSDPEKRAQFDRGDDPNSHEHQGSPFQGSPFQGGQQFFFQSGGGGGHQRFFQQGGMPFNFPGGFQFQGM